MKKKIKILFFFILISYATAIEIGFISKNLNSDSYKAIKNYADALSQNMSIVLEITDLAFDSPTYAEDLADPTMTVAITHCALNIDAEKAGYIAGNGTVLWCYDLYTEAGCPKSSIPGLSVITPIELSIFILSSLHSKYFALIFDKNVALCDFYYKHVIHEIDLFAGEIIYDIHNQTITDQNVADYISTLTKYKDEGVITLLLLNDVAIITKINTERSVDFNDIDNFPMLLYEGGITLDDVVKGGGTLSDLSSTYSITSFNKEYISDSSDVFKQYFEPYKSTLQEDLISVAFAIIDILAFADNAIPSPKIFTMFTYVYGKAFNYSSGEIELLNSHYMTSTHYMYHIKDDSGTAKYIYDYTLPLDNTIQADQYESLMDEKLCDFAEDPENGYIDPEYLPVMILLDMSSYEAKILWIYITELFDNLNTNKDTLGKQLHPILLNRDKGINIVIPQIHDYFKTKDVNTIFILTSSEDREAVYEEFKNENNFEIFYFGPNEGEACYSNVLFANFNKESYVREIYKYARNQGYENSAIVGTTEIFGKSARVYVKNYFISQQMNGSNILEMNIDNTTAEEANRTAGTIYNTYKDNGTIVILTCEASYLEILFKTFKKWNITKENNYEIISMNLNQLIAQGLGYELFTGSLIIEHSSNELGSENLEKFSDYLSGVFGKEIPITATMAFIYNVMELYIDSILSSSSTSPSLYREYIYHTIPSSVAYGIYEIYTNGMARGAIKIFRMKSDGTTDLVYEPTFVEESFAFGSAEQLCSFSDNSMITGQQEPYKIGMIFNRNSESWVTVLDTLEIVIDMFNIDGGLNGRRVITTQIGWNEGDTEDMRNKVEAMIKSESPLCLVGTNDKTERDAISDLLEYYDILLFSILLSGGEEEYPNVIQMNAVPNQIFSLPLLYFLQQTLNVVILRSTDSYNHQNIGGYLDLYLNNLGIIPKLEVIVNEPLDFDIVVENITNHTLGLEKTVIISEIFTYTESFLDSYYRKVDNISRFKILLMDYTIRVYLNANNQTLFQNCYYSATYSPAISTILNTALVNNVKRYKGDAETLLDDTTMSFYNSLLFVDTALKALSVSFKTTATVLKTYFYENSIDCPVGLLRLSRSNYINVYPFLIHIEEDSEPIVVQMGTSITAAPYYNLRNDDKFIYTDFSVTPYVVKETLKFIGIAFVLDLTDIENYASFLSYIHAVTRIEKLNVDEGIRRTIIKYELYNCPTVKNDASSLIIDLKARGFPFVIGGCNPTIKNYMLTAFESIDSLLFYTGVDEGQECLEKIMYLSTTPYQEIYPIGMHLLYQSLKNPHFIYMTLELYQSRVEFLRSIFVGVNNDFVYEAGIDILADNYLDEMKKQLVEIRNRFVFSKDIIVMFHNKYLNEFLNMFNEKVCQAEGLTPIECSKEYHLYIIDDTQIKFDKGGAGQTVYTPFMNDGTENCLSYYEEIETLGAGEYNPNFYDELNIVANHFLLQAITDAADLEVSSVKTQLYTASITSCLGTISMEETNHFSESIMTGIIDENGDLQYIGLITGGYSTNPYRTSFNTAEYRYCDWKDKLGDNLVRESVHFAAMIPTATYLYKEGIMFADTLLSAVSDMNNRGGVKGDYLILIIYSDGGSAENAVINTLKVHDEYGIKIYFGGWLNDIREAVYNCISEFDGLLFLPMNYEGDSCLYNGYSMGFPFVSYYPIYNWIIENNPGVLILIYSTSHYSTSFAKFIQDEISSFSVEFDYKFIVPEETDDLSSILDIVTIKAPEGALVLSLLEGVASPNLLLQMYEAGISSALYPILSIDLAGVAVNELGKAAVGHYYVAGYNKEGKGNAETVQQVNSVTTNLQKRFSFLTSLSDRMARAYSAMMLLENIIDTTGTMDISVLKPRLYTTSVVTPLGPFKFQNNNHIASPFIIRKVSQNEDGIIEVTSSFITTNDMIIDPYISIFRGPNEMKQCIAVSSTSTTFDVIKIGILLSTTGTLADVHRPVLLGVLIALEEIIDKGNILGSVPVSKIANYESDTSLIESKAHELFDDPLVKLVVGCYDTACRTLVQPIARVSNAIYFFPRKSVGQECDKYTFYVGPVPNQYIADTLEYLITLDITKSMVIIKSSDEIAQNIGEMVKYEADGLFVVEDDITISDSNPISSNMITSITNKNLKDGGVIMFLVTDMQEIQSFLRMCVSLRVDVNKYPLIDVISEIEHYETFTEEQRGSVYLIGNYFSDLDTDENREFKRKASDYGNLPHPTVGTNAAYASVMFYYEAVTTLNSYDNLEDIRNQLINTQITDGSGKIEMTDNHYPKLPIFIARYNNEGTSVETVSENYNLQTPMAWNWNIEETYGKKCSWSKNINSEMYDVLAARVLLIAPITGALSESSLGTVDAFKLATNELNDKNGGVFGYRLKPEIYDTKSQVATCVSLLSNYIETQNAPAIFFVNTIECRTAIETKLKEKNILLFHFLVQDIGYCNENVMISTHHVSLDEPLLNAIRNRFYDEILVITVEQIFEQSGKYYYNKLHDLSVNVILYHNVADASKRFEKWKEDRAKNGSLNNAIIYRGYSNGFFDIETNLTKYELAEPDVRLIVIEPSSTIILSPYSNFEVFEAYRAEDESPENDAFADSMNERINKATTSINDITSALYSSVMIWSHGVEQAKSFEPSVVRRFLSQYEYDSPEGKMRFGENNYLRRTVSDSFIDANLTSHLLHYTGYMHTPNAFDNDANGNLVKCNFNDVQIGNGRSVNTYTIGIILSLSGSLKESETPVFDSILSAINYLNNNGQVLGYYLNYKVYDVESNINKYEELINSAISGGLVYLFGGVNPDHYEVITSIMKDKQAYFFFCGHTYSTQCPSNVITGELNPSQLAISGIRKSLEETTSVVLIYSSDNYTQTLNNYMVDYLGELNILLMGNIKYDGHENAPQLQRLSIANSNGYIIATLNSNELYKSLFEDLCGYSMTPPNWIVLLTLFDENLLYQIEPSCLNGNKVIGTYFESVGESSKNSFTIPYLATEFNQELHVNIGSDKYFRSEFETAFTMVMFWQSLVADSNSFEYESFSLLYDYYIDTPSESVELSVNNIFKRLIYSGTIQDRSISINWHPTAYIEADLYNQWDGDLRGYVCDWNKGYKEMYNTDPVHVAFIHESDIGSQSEKFNLLIQNIAIDEINDGNGILGKLLIADHYFVISSKVYAEMRTIITGSTNLKAIFGCMTPTCRTEAQRYLEAANSDIIFDYLGREDGYTCSPYVLSTGVTINQKAEPTLNYIYSMGLLNLFVIGNSDNSSTIMETVVKNLAIEKGFNYIGAQFFTPYNPNELISIIAKFQTIFVEVERFVIIDLFSGAEQDKFLTYYYADTTIDRDSITLFFMNYDSHDLSDSVISSLSGSYIVSPYTSEIKSTTSGAFSYSIQQIYQSAITLGEIFETSYSSIYLWKAAIEYAKENGDSEDDWPDYRYIRLSMKYVNYDGPGGTMKMQYNNHATRQIYIFRVSGSNKIQVYPNQGKAESFEAKLTFMSDEDCNLGKNLVLYEYNSALSYVVIVFMALVMLLSVVVGGIIFTYRSSRIIHASSPLFLYYTLLGVILESVSGLIFTLYPNDVVCAMRVWWLAISVDFLFSILFCKAWRIHKLFNNKEMKRVKISNLMLLKIIGAIELAQAIYLMIWWLVDRAKYTESYSVDYSDYLDDVYIRECTANDIFTYIEIVGVVLLFLWGAKLAWATRKASSEFNESISLASTIVLMIILGILEIPLNVLMEKQPDTLLMLRGLGVELGAIATLALQFASKLTYLWVNVVHGSTTLGSSSLSGSANSKASRSLARKGAVRGRFAVKPDVFQIGNIGLCSLSMPGLFYVEDKGISSVSIRSSSRRNVSARSPSSREAGNMCSSGRNVDASGIRSIDRSETHMESSTMD